LALLFLSSLSAVPGTSAIESSLKAVYAGGTITLTAVMTIDDSLLPEGILFEAVTDIALDSSGNLYICDMNAHNIKAFTPEGQFIKVIGRPGQGPGEFNHPYRIAALGNGILVWDMDNERLCALTAEGEFLKSIPVQRAEGRPQKMKSLPDGNVVIEKEIVHFGEKDIPQDCIIQIAAPDLTLKKTILSHPIWRNKYRKIQGMFTNILQPFSPGVHWDVTPQGDIVIGFSADYSIEIHHAEKGKLSAFSHKHDPVKVTDEDKEIYFSSLYFGPLGDAKKGIPKELRNMHEFPKVKPAFTGLLVDPEGNILVFPSRKAGGKSDIVFDAFDSEGRFIGKVRAATTSSFPSRSKVDKEFIWSIERDDEGYSKVVKYRITN
jgi:hypothetical protein